MNDRTEKAFLHLNKNHLVLSCQQYPTRFERTMLLSNVAIKILEVLKSRM